jgi:hypothetical protein
VAVVAGRGALACGSASGRGRDEGLRSPVRRGALAAGALARRSATARPRGRFGEGWGPAAAGGVAVAYFVLLVTARPGSHQSTSARSPLAGLAGHLVVVRGPCHDPEPGPRVDPPRCAWTWFEPVVLAERSAAPTEHDAVWVEGGRRRSGFEAGDRPSDRSGTLEPPSGRLRRYLVHRGYPAAWPADEPHAARLRAPCSGWRGHACHAPSSLERVFGPKEAGWSWGLVLGDTLPADPRIEGPSRATACRTSPPCPGRTLRFLAPILPGHDALGLGRWSRFLVGSPRCFLRPSHAGRTLGGQGLRSCRLRAQRGLSGSASKPPAILGGAVRSLLGDQSHARPTHRFSSRCAPPRDGVAGGPVARTPAPTPVGVPLAARTTLAPSGVTPLLPLPLRSGPQPSASRPTSWPFPR